MAGIYIHIPFCKKACHYCNFHFSTSLAHAQKMVDAICTEIELRSSAIAHKKIDTVYFGGGTPGILTVQQLQQITNTLTTYFDCAQLQEFTIEVNPDDMTQEKLRALQQIGCNRLSIGVQSFVQEHLLYMNRSHTASKAIDCIALAQKIGFHNLSIDLIYGFPLLSAEQWESNVRTAWQAGITHLSCYALTIEPRTAFESMVAKGKIAAIDTEQSATHFESLMQWVSNEGWEHYEISNFAKPNHRAIHNTNYWTGKPYHGFGPSAHSFDGNTIRSWNIAHNIAYINSISQNKLPAEQEELTASQKINEYIMTNMRRMEGMEKVFLQNALTAQQWQALNTTIEKHASFFSNTASHIVFNSNGKLMADWLASELFL